MGKMSLGLDDRSARLIHGRDVWPQIKDLLSGYGNIQAAIAFVGSDADHYLPLRGPATIVVNAGDEALAKGSTDPDVLLRWTRRGVRVYSLSSMHAKVILADGDPPFVLVGSADVQSASGRPLDEALLVADERETVDELREVIGEWRRQAGQALTESWLQAAAGRFRPAAPYRSAPSYRAAVPESPPRVRPPVAVAIQPSVERSAGVELSPAVAPLPVEASPVDGSPVEESAPAPAMAESASAPVPAVRESMPAVPDPAIVSADPLPRSAARTSAEPDPPPTAPEHGQQPADSALPVGNPAVVPWPRPKYIYLATLTRDGRASDSSIELLEQLRDEFRVPAGGTGAPILQVEMFWWDQPERSGGRQHTTYREGWHLVPISVPASGRPAVLSAVDSPGRVLQSFTEYLGGPARTYYYLLGHAGGPPTTFRKLREALASVGEKPSYDHAYMMQHKVTAILDLWPQITYTG